MRGANVFSRPDDLSRIEEDIFWLPCRAGRAEETMALSERQRRLTCAAFIFSRRRAHSLDVVAGQDHRMRDAMRASLIFDDEDVRRRLLGETRLFEERR